MWNEAKWLKVPVKEIERQKIYHGDMTGRFAYFRCETDLPEKAHLTVDISASSRYRLWVNNRPVLSGPCKGDVWRQYYETIELTDLLLPGRNVFCVQVLYNDPNTAEIQTDERAAIYGVMGILSGHRLAVEGDIFKEDGTVADTLTTGRADWRVWLENSFYLKSSDITCYLGAVTEEIDFSKMPVHWKEKGFDASGWMAAETADTVIPKSILFSVGVQPKFRIREREIPLLYEKEEVFERDFSRRDKNAVGLLEKGSITVEPGQDMELILDAGAVKNGYPCYPFRGGKGGKITITYFEKFGGQGSDLRRTDYENGEIFGLTDTVSLPGGEVCYEPFWVRTFRFVCIHIHAQGEAVTLLTPKFRRTGYPLKPVSYIRSSSPWVERLWDICVRTLENCMMETYMDCPYYEQLQFAMDTRLEALFTYAVSNDYALARKALIDFHYGMQPEGLTAGKYPSAYLQVLSTFSLHYIYMLWEYYRQTGDRETVRFCQGDIDRILDYFDIKIGRDGLVGRLEFWEFVDWQPDWAEFSGIPRALQQGASTIINLMYAYALSCAGSLFAAMGRNGLAEEYQTRRKKILEAVHRLCWDAEKGMYREGPECFQFTQHAQSWAVLNGLVEGEAARAVLVNAIEDKECLKCSFSTAYEWFRALEKAEMYGVMRECLNDWISLLELECTTCPETPEGARSECHAWSALPMYEMIRTMAGVIPEGIGWEHVRIRPNTMDLEDLQGKVATPKGDISFRYEKAEGVWNYFVELPEGMEATFVYPDGKTEQLYHNTHNPLLPPKHHMPDVEAHVMSDGKLYLYGSYDACKKEYCSDFYRVASTEDMKNWKVSGKIMKGTDVPWFDKSAGVEESQGEPTPFIRKMLEEMEKNPELDYFGTAAEKEQEALLYAPDCMEKDGKYYLYFCMSDGSEGVAVSESPDGAFGSFVRMPCKGIDPAVFLDDDGKAYYFWGQFSANGVMLNDDCSSFDSDRVVHGLVTEQEHYFHEGFSMRKIGDTYYAVFSDIEHGKPTSLGYATAKSPLGPFSYGGVIIDNSGCDPATWNNHGSIECFQGQWYVFYHRSSRNTKINRRVCAEKIEILPDGRIPEVLMTSQGPGEPFEPEERMYGFQACGCFGKCYIDYDVHSGEEYLKVTEDGDRAVFRYLSLKTLPQSVEIRSRGRAVIDICLNGVYVGGGEIAEDGKTVFLLDCSRIDSPQAEIELVFKQAEELELNSMVFHVS